MSDGTSDCSLHHAQRWTASGQCRRLHQSGGNIRARQGGQRTGDRRQRPQVGPRADDTDAYTTKWRAAHGRCRRLHHERRTATGNRRLRRSATSRKGTEQRDPTGDVLPQHTEYTHDLRRAQQADEVSRARREQREQKGLRLGREVDGSRKRKLRPRQHEGPGAEGGPRGTVAPTPP